LFDSAGLPQIVLPCWWDTYEFAIRVEYLGIGIYGSRKSKSAPKANGVEFGESLIALNDEDNENSRLIRERARKLAEVCNAYGGRVKAADKILEFAASAKKETDKKIVDNGKAK
jgi:UDP:flavonoid glycosyltransferase YjiC (YdhE family)